MSNSEDQHEQENEDSIKAAVREATKKTQERLAAYQKKQAASKAKAGEEQASKGVTKEVAQAEDTVAKLQALVGESRRLTAKSKEKTKELAAAASVPPPTTKLHRSSSTGNSLMSHQTPKGKRMSAAAAVTKLNSSSSGLNYSDVNTPKAPGLKRSVTMDSASMGTPSSLTPGGSLAKGKKLGAIFQSLNKPANNKKENLNGSLADLTAGISKLASDDFKKEAKKDPGYLSPSKGKSTRKKPLKGSIKEESLNDISNSSHEMIDAIEIDEDDYSDEEEPAKGKQQQSNKKKKKDKAARRGSAANNDGGEFSIFSLVDDGMKQTAKTAGVQGLRDDEMQDLMEDYYTEPTQTAASEDESEQMENSMALLELDQPSTAPKSDKVKSKGAGKKKKKGKTTDDIGTEKGSKKEAKKMGKSLSNLKHEAEPDVVPVDDDMDCSMPMLAPFETPKVDRPKLMQALANNEISASNLDISKKSPLPSNEESLNLSQIMRQPDILPNQASSSRSNSPHRSSSKNRSSSSRRKSNGVDDDKSARSKSKKSSRRSSLSKNASDHKKNEEIANRAINAYHRKDGQGSSTMEGLNICEKTGEIKGSNSQLDISAISENSAENDSSMQDGSDSMGGGSSLGGSSHHSTRSTRSMSRSSRRGRTAGGGDGGRSRGVSRSRSTRGPRARSVSRTRSASVRRNQKGRRASNLEGEDKSRRGRRASIAGTKADDNNDRSMKDVSSRRARLQASARDSSMRDSSRRDNRNRRSISTRRPGRRNQRGSRAEDDSESNLEQSERSTAEDILGSLDVSDIKIVGAESSDSTEDKKAKKKNSLALLSKLESSAPSNDNDDENVSVSESVQSSATKKSKMGKFARKMGRRLTMKKKKDKKGEDDDSEEEEEGADEEDLALLAAEFDEEEREIYEKSGTLHESFSKGDFSAASVMDDLTTDDDSDNKKSSKKKQRASVFGKFKIGKMGGGKKKEDKKKDKKKDKKPKGSKPLESDSESDNSESSEDELLGSEYSSNSESNNEDMEDSNEEAYAQLQIDGDNKSSVVTADGDDPAPIATKGRVPRRSSAITNRRQRANQQRSMSLHAALEQAPRLSNSRAADEGSVSTAAAMRNRRARSLRGKVVRKSVSGDGDAALPPGSRLNVDVKRAKSLKGRIEGEAAAVTKGGKKIRRTRSVEFEKMGGDADGEAPAFDWTAYSNQKEAPPKDANRRNFSKRKSHAEKRKSQADKRMSGGLSKIIYASQPVTS